MFRDQLVVATAIRPVGTVFAGASHWEREHEAGLYSRKAVLRGMADQLAAALKKLEAVSEQLEKAVELRLEREESLLQSEAEVQRMGADRARLAESLDNAEARAQRLESANREVSRRLVDAMESIRSVLDQPGGH